MIDFEEIITRNREKDRAYIINIQDCIKCCLHDKSNSINKVQVLISIVKCFLPKAFIIQVLKILIPSIQHLHTIWSEVHNKRYTHQGTVLCCDKVTPWWQTAMKWAMMFHLTSPWNTSLQWSFQTRSLAGWRLH